ncbi:MAG: pilus assembly protein [Burkholderiales bacterium]|nr:pilus assembly protein [Burkholderiales bacterium]MDE2394708.1 pilus assembly protein [Burkholderiales bacterium]MDE2452649.1 pilus assembly protein [Burkholderiales bacterium]
MVEVLVTIVVVAIGLLGLAKLEAAALSNTQVSRTRSLIAVQAGSLAAAMHANPGYWSAGVAAPSFSISGGVVTDASGVLATMPSPGCGPGNVCTPSVLAAWDVNNWAQNMNQMFPTALTTVTCTITAGSPISCNLQINWSEKQVGVNLTTTASASLQTSTEQFTLLVQP